MLKVLGTNHVALVIGPTNSGKTNSLIDLGAKSADAGKRVIHFTSEVPATEVADRYMKNHNMIEQKVTAPDKYVAFLGAKGKDEPANISIHTLGRDPFGYELIIVDDVLHLIAGWEADLVIIDDLLQILSNKRDEHYLSVETHNKLVSEYVRYLRNYAIETDTQIWISLHTGTDFDKANRDFHGPVMLADNVVIVKSTGERDHVKCRSGYRTCRTILVHDTQGIANEAEAYIIVGLQRDDANVPDEARELHESESDKGIPTAIARHPEYGIMVIQNSGQGPYIIWSETEFIQ